MRRTLDMPRGEAEAMLRQWWQTPTPILALLNTGGVRFQMRGYVRGVIPNKAILITERPGAGGEPFSDDYPLYLQTEGVTFRYEPQREVPAGLRETIADRFMSSVSIRFAGGGWCSIIELL